MATTVEARDREVVASPADILAIDDRLAGLMDGFDPHSVLPGDAMACWEAFDRIAKRAEAAKVLLTEQVTRSGAWRRGGYKTPADHLAVKAGTSKSAAKRAERTAKELDKLPATAAAARRGDLSGQQLEVIVDAASVNPGAEARLLRHAQHSTLRSVQEEAAKARAEVENRDAVERRAHLNRSYKSFTRLDGTFGASVQGTTVAGAEINQVIEIVTEQIFEEHRTAGSHEAREAYQFDALHRICTAYVAHTSGAATGTDAVVADTGGALPKGARPELPYRFLVNVRCDVEALVRGYTVGDELCEIAGIGQVPVNRVRDLFGDAIVKIILTNGTDVRDIVPAGRGWTAKQRMAVTWQHGTCCVSDCDNPRVEIDHVQGWTQGGPTVTANAKPRCNLHHKLKTNGWGDHIDHNGALHAVPPDDPRHPDNQSRPPP